MPLWLKYYNLEYNIKSLDQATPDSWYPVAINFWNFEKNYLTAMDDRLLDLLSKKKIRVLFYYREADDPLRIRGHIKSMCDPLGINADQILLISGNTHADSVNGAKFFWHFDTDYYFRCRNIGVLPVNHGSRERKVTCLSRIKKNWREWFVYNLMRFSEKDYISCGIVDPSPFHESDDFVLWDENNTHLTNVGRLDILPPNDQWLDSLPIKADDLTADQHNDHSIVIEKFFQDSYWNIVLETLLDTESTPGVFLTEKTLKPIRNGQSFVILGCQNSLELLHRHGYMTFDGVIDESYDAVQDIRQRWYRVFEIAKYLVTSDFHTLDRLQNKNLPAIEHNARHFQRSRRPILEDFLKTLCR